MDIKEYKQQLLDELYKPYKKCMQCPLGSLGRTTVVFGEGNPNAHFMLIGEGPGADEDAQGRPFVGRSGKLLTKILEALEIARSEIFITNIVKCRPPNNRKPLPTEASACKKLLLEKQIKIIQPTIICTLGASAIENLIEKKVQITKVRGKEFDYRGVLVIPAYHPAYVLRNPKELKTLARDIEVAYQKIKPMPK